MEDVSVSKDTWVDVHAVFGFIVEAELVEMLTRAPQKSCRGPIPINLVDDVVFEEPSADAGILNGVMGKDEGLAMGEEVLAGGVVSNRVSLPFEIMVLPGSAVRPGMIAPDDASVPVVLVEVGEITAINPKISEFISRDEGSPR